ncbi:MAG: hypothetical protein ACREBC_36955 [Pyrinomonadaceae bacterium]
MTVRHVGEERFEGLLTDAGQENTVVRTTRLTALNWGEVVCVAV